MSNCCANSASVLSPRTAARATFALKAGVWFRRGRLVIVSPGLQPFWLLSGRNSTYPDVQISWASSLDVTFHRRSSERAVGDCESLEELEFGGLQAAAASAGGPVWRAGPDLRRVSGTRRKASKFRKRAASASLTSPGVRVAASRRGGSERGSAVRPLRSAGPTGCGRSERGGASAAE